MKVEERVSLARGEDDEREGRGNVHMDGLLPFPSFFPT